MYSPRETHPLSVKIIKGNAYGLPVGKVFPYARRKEGNGSPFPISIFSYGGNYRSYQMKEDEVEILKPLAERV